MVRVINNDINKIQFEPKPVPKFVWTLCSGATLVGILLQSASIVSPNWRHSEPVTYNFMHRGTKRQHTIEETKYGLYTVLFNNGTFRQTWAEKVESVKSKGYLAIQASADNGRGQYDNFFASECPAACRDAIAARIVSYENILGYNNLLMMVLTVTTLLALLGIVWNLLFDMNIFLIGGSWLFSGVCSIMCMAYWNLETHANWKIVCRQQMIPFPYLASAYHYMMLGSIIIIGSALLLFFAGMVTSFFRRRKMTESLNAQLRDQNALGFGFNAMANNPMMGNVPFMPAQAPMMPQPANQQQVTDFNPSSLFNGVDFNKSMYLGNNNQSPNTPSVWNRNFQF